MIYKMAALRMVRQKDGRKKCFRRWSSLETMTSVEELTVVVMVAVVVWCSAALVFAGRLAPISPAPVGGHSNASAVIVLSSSFLVHLR